MFALHNRYYSTLRITLQLVKIETGDVRRKNRTGSAAHNLWIMRGRRLSKNFG
jgi:hypothetical protein